ncbi:DUF1049 domain-containing protein [Streptomyces sp. bgisy031]|uniref:DUF1049 domain-containing protein n=1 Tax=Streptomyces sp. bgisy031 TaxID=3413772 RepID=UPI003D753F10
MSPKDTASPDRGAGTGTFTPGRIAIIVLVVLVVVFVFENTWRAGIRLAIPEVSTPLFLALVAVAVVGAICGCCFIRRRR